MEPEYELFWGGYLSNWHIAPFTISGARYNCVEQWMMHSKALHFHDMDTARRVMATPHPKAQKELGRKVKGFRENSWAAVREDIVFLGTCAKYRQNPDLLKLLLATGNKTIVEASPYDTIWGIGLAEDDPRAKDPSKWRGQNLLGKVIMHARAVLARE